jgi:hypothetical protein
MAKKKNKKTNSKKKKTSAMSPNVKSPTKKQLRRYGSKDILQPGAYGGYIGPSN